MDDTRNPARDTAQSTVVFAVEHAGCPTCAARVREALSPFATIVGIEIDESEDVATVEALPRATTTEERINAALLEASGGSGHAYRVKPQSWRVASER